MFVLFSILSLSTVRGYSFNELSLSSVPSEGADIGIAVSIFDEFAVVGAESFSVGAASIFRLNHTWNTWYEFDQVTGSTHFGTFLALSNETLFVSGRTDDGPAAIYELQLDELGGETWVPSAFSIITTNVGDSRSSTAMTDKYLVVGHYRCHTLYSGCAMIYQKSLDGTSWDYLTQVTASNGNLYHHFGQAVDIWKDEQTGETFFIVGASMDRTSSDIGSAYVYYINDSSSVDGTVDINEVAILKPDDDNIEHIGMAVSIFDNYAAVAAANTESGDYWSVYFYQRDDQSGNWTEMDRFFGSEPYTSGDYPTVDLFNNYCIVGNPNYKNGQGEVFILHRSHSTGTWYQIEHITNETNTFENELGRSAGIYDNHAIVGASGAAYMISNFKPDSISSAPTGVPSDSPTSPTINPTIEPSNNPSEYPSLRPSFEPSLPTQEPSFEPSAEPSTSQSTFTTTTTLSLTTPTTALADEQNNNQNCDNDESNNVAITLLACLIGFLVCTNVATLFYFWRQQKKPKKEENINAKSGEKKIRVSLAPEVAHEVGDVSNASNVAMTSVVGTDAGVGGVTGVVHTAEGAVTLAPGSTAAGAVAGAGVVVAGTSAGTSAGKNNQEEEVDELFVMMTKHGDDHVQQILGVVDDDEEVYGSGSTPMDSMDPMDSPDAADNGTTNGRSRGAGEQSVFENNSTKQ